jgi:hypothetical protein
LAFSTATVCFSAEWPGFLGIRSTAWKAVRSVPSHRVRG